MSKSNLRNRHRQRQPLLLLLLLILLWAISGGLVMAKFSTATTISQSELISNVDVVPSRYQSGLSIYLENCSTCHIAIPPQALPTETWQIILQDSQHYGVQVPTLFDPPRQIVWNYLQVYSRQKSPQEEKIPYRIGKSRYFKALHPKVELPPQLTIKTCVSCHPLVKQFDFRTLSSEWED